MSTAFSSSGAQGFGAAPPMLHVVLAGPGVNHELIESDDVISEMTMLKYRFPNGIKAQKGVDF